MTRTECLEKLNDVVFSLDTLITVIRMPSDKTIGNDCEVYEDEAQNLTDALNALRTNYGNETREEFSTRLKNE